MSILIAQANYYTWNLTIGQKIAAAKKWKYFQIIIFQVEVNFQSKSIATIPETIENIITPIYKKFFITISAIIAH